MNSLQNAGRGGAPLPQDSARGAESAPLQKRHAPEHFRPPRPGSPPTRVRLNYEKTGPSALLGHLDFIRELPRLIRRAGMRTAYSEGFHPKPDMTFGPALALGVASIDEYLDIKLIDPPAADELVAALNRASSGGVHFVSGALLGDQDPGLAKIVDAARFVIGFSAAVLAPDNCVITARSALAEKIATFAASEEVTVTRDVKGIKRKIDIKAGVLSIRVGSDEDFAQLARAGVMGVAACFSVTVSMTQSGSVRPSEIVHAIVGADMPFIAARTALLANGISPLSLSAHLRPLTQNKKAGLEANASL